MWSKLNSYRLLFRDLWSHFRFQLVILIVVMAVAGLIEGLAVALLLPLFVRLGIASMPGNGMLNAVLLGLDSILGDSWIYLVSLIVAVSLLQGVLILVQGWLTARLTQSYAAKWKLRLVNAFIFADWTYLSARKSGELINAITTETGRLAAAAQNLMSLVAVLIVGVIYLAYGFALSAPITWSILLLAAVLILLLGQLYRVSFELGQQVGPLQAEQQVVVGEFLQGIKAVKAAAMEERAIQRIWLIVSRLDRANKISVFLPHVVRAVFETGGLIALVMLLVVAVTWMQIPLANLLVVVALFVRLFPRISSLQQYLHSLNSYVPAVSAAIGMAKEAEARAERASEVGTDVVPIEMPSVLRIEDLNVSLGGDLILRCVSLDIPIPGLTAIVGASGSGKSTLLSSLLRLVPIESGTVSLQKKSIHHLSLTQWRRAIGFVPQDPILFHASIRDNLSIAWPDKSLDDLIAAAKLAELHDFISELPQGYDTIVGDQGMRLSGGQRQRLGLARALLGNPKLLILDEATSALDSITEGAILETLVQLKERIGVVLVTHRMASVRRADQIAVLEAGAIVGVGSWSELTSRSDIFNAYASAHDADLIVSI